MALTEHVVSMAGLQGFWDALRKQTTPQSVMPLSRWDVDACYDPEAPAGCSYVRFAALAEVLPVFTVQPHS